MVKLLSALAEPSVPRSLLRPILSLPNEFNMSVILFISMHPVPAMNPAAVLSVYQQINKKIAPPSYMLMIRGYEFELGEGFTEQAENNLQQSFEFVKDLLQTRVEKWPNKVIMIDEPD